jgi:hypothetical protein
MKPTAWYDPSNGVVSTDRDCPLFTPLGQVWPLYPKQEDDGVTLPTIRHPRGKPALGALNPASLETMEIDLPEPIGYVSEGSAERLAAVKQAHEQIRSFRLFAHDVPVYTSPPQRWAGLTDEDIGDAYVAWDDTDGASFADFARAIEAKLKQKNGYAEEKNT